MSYPPPLYTGGSGEKSAWVRPGDAEPDLVYPNGNRVHYVARGEATGGLFGLYRWEFAGPPSGPGSHFHKTMSESFYVLESIKGGLADENAEVARRVFAGDRGPARDAVLLNTGTALAVATGASGTSATQIHEAIGSGVERAAQAIDSGAAAAQLDRWISASRTVAAS